MRSIHPRRPRASRILTALLALSALGAITGCGQSVPQQPGTQTPPETLTLLTHDSFALSDGTLEMFTDETGIDVEVLALGDGGALANQLVLTADAPLGDVVYGIDTTFASRVVGSGALADHVTGTASDANPDLLLPVDAGGGQLTPIDFSDVCVNADLDWFADAGLEPPQTLDDLLDRAYADLFVTPSATTSSPGLAFLLATIAANGDAWPDYWRQLLANGTKVVSDWETAYYVDFSGPSSEGDRPLVLSYASSPPYEARDDGTSPTAALLDTCFRQVEYAGVLAGTAHENAAAQLVDYLYSVPVQTDIPENMYVYPANPGAELPPSWVELAPLAEHPFTIDPADLDANRDAWLSQWSELVGS